MSGVILQVTPYQHFWCLLTAARDAISNKKSSKSLTSEPSLMEAKKRRKTKGTVIIGRGAATVRIYPIIRKNGYVKVAMEWLKDRQHSA